MKKYLLIPVFLIAAIATANAGCGGCESKKSCDSECAKECCPKEKGKCCGEGGECCKEKDDDHTHE